MPRGDDFPTIGASDPQPEEPTVDQRTATRWIALATVSLAIAAAWFAAYTAFISVPQVPSQDAAPELALNALFVWFAENGWQMHAILFLLAVGYLSLGAVGVSLRASDQDAAPIRSGLSGTALLAGGVIGAAGAFGQIGLHQGVVFAGAALGRQATTSIIWFVGDAVAGAVFGGAWLVVAAGMAGMALAMARVPEGRLAAGSSAVLATAIAVIAAMYLLSDPIDGLRQTLLGVSGLVLFPIWAVTTIRVLRPGPVRAASTAPSPEALGA